VTGLLLAAWCAAFGLPQGWRPLPAESPVRLAAVDRGAKLTLVETRIPPAMSFMRFARNEPRMIRAALRARDVRVRNDGRVLRVRYLLGTTTIRQWFVPTGRLVYVLTLTSQR
jgi:hypothetical protein